MPPGKGSILHNQPHSTPPTPGSDAPNGAAASYGSVVNIYAGGAWATSPVAPPWEDPSSRLELPLPVVARDLQLRDAIARIERERILIVECPWAELQLYTVSAIAAELNDSDEAAVGRVTRHSGSHANEISSQARWGLADLTRPELGQRSLRRDAALVILELDGSANDCLLLTELESPSARHTLTEELRRLHRYLFLLPRDDRSLAHSPRGRRMELPSLVVPTLRTWLEMHYPDTEPAQLHGLEQELLRRLERRDWSSPRQLHDHLRLVRSERFVDLRRVLDDAGTPEPVEEVQAALEQCDPKDEIFLTVIFAATYLAPLQERDLLQVVSALLGDRTRRDDTPGHACACRPVPIELATEWRDTARSVLQRAHLISRQERGGSREIIFRAPAALPKLRNALAAAPLFLDTQLRYLQLSGLLFHPHPPLRAAVLELLSGAVADAPERFASDWLLATLKHQLHFALPRDAHGTVQTVQLHDRLSHTFTCMEDLLLALVAAVERRPDAQLVTSTGVAPSKNRRETALDIVHGVLQELIVSGGAMALTGLELAFRLRRTADVDTWRLVRGAFMRDDALLREHCDRWLSSLLLDPSEGSFALEQLIAWLHQDLNKEDLAPAMRVAAISLLGRSLGSSFRRSAPARADRSGATAPLPPLLALAAQARDQPGGLARLLLVLAELMDVEQADAPFFATLVLPETLWRLSEKERVTLINALEEHSEAKELRTHVHGSRTSTRLRVTAHVASRRLAIFMVAWQLAHPGQRALFGSIASAARELLLGDYPLVQHWLRELGDLMRHTAAAVMSDWNIAVEHRRIWHQEHAESEAMLVELHRALGTPSPDPSEVPNV